MSPRTRGVLLWLAGIGGALVIVDNLLDALRFLGRYVPATALGVLLVLALAAAVALAAVRSRLDDDRLLAFTETRP